MRLWIALLIAFCLCGQAPSPSIDDFKKRIASFPPDEQVYELWRFWLVGQPSDVQRLFDKEDTKAKGLELYRGELRAEGDPAAEIERKISHHR